MIFDNSISQKLSVKSITVSDKKENPVFAKAGKRGGKITLAKYGKNHFSRIAKLRHKRARAKARAESGA